MASAYAPPPPRSNYHAHSHSYSGIHSSPGKAAANGFANGNGSLGRSPVPNGFLFTHTESSRETSPVQFPDGDQSHTAHFQSIEHNVSTFQQDSRVSKHKHNHSEPSMKSRPRGESDLGRPAEETSSTYQPSLESIPAVSTSWFSLPEALTSMLVTVPYILASTTYSSMSGISSSDFTPLPKYAPLPQLDLPEAEILDPVVIRQHGFIDACVLASGTLLIVGIFAKMQPSEPAFDKDKEIARASVDIRTLLGRSYLKSMTLRALSLWLPFYASILLGGSRTGLILLVAITTNLICSDGTKGSLIEQWKHLWASKVATSVVILLSFMADEVGLTIQAPLSDLMLGYLALAASVLALPPPLPTLAVIPLSGPNSKRSSPAPPSDSWLRRGSGSIGHSTTSLLISSPSEVDMTLISGVILGLLSVFASTLSSYSPSISTSSLLLITLTVAFMALAILFSQPPTLRNEGKAGLALGCLLTASSSFLFSPSLWPGTVCNGGLSALSFLGVWYDTQKSSSGRNEHERELEIHTHHHHHHHHHNKDSGPSVFSQFLLARCEPGSLVFGILNEKDSRRIAYFTTLNFGFMLVQGVYGYLSGSLGLLSDTVHMFFDCFGLVVGLGAAIASKWPTSPERPYGWSKLNTLSGFGNGIFLMLVSIEFTWEAIEGILEQRQLRHVQELLVVSVLGLLVNAIGLMFFHSHAGHDHGGHSHSNGNLESHSRNVSEDHAGTHLHDHSHHHHHDHSNDNMHGIFLHIAADAGGSIAVILSTALNLWMPSFVWDPLATILIAVLIFAAAVPLVISSGQKLLLVVPSELEYTIKDTLQDVGDLRGVVGYSVPRFWVDDKDDTTSESHGHNHGACENVAKKRIMGVVHVIVEASSDLDDVRDRVEAFIAERNMNIVVQIEREGEGYCWCSSGPPRSE